MGRGHGWNRSPLTETVNCLNCQKPFEKRPSRIGQVHCSLECRKEYNRKHPKPQYVRHSPGKRPIATYTCKVCNREFQARKRATPQLYCSRACSAQHIHEPRRWPIQPCQYCQQPFRPRQSKKFYCSQACKELAGVNFFGKKLQAQHRTDIEAIVEKCLQSLNIRYKWECPFGRCRVDFYLPDYNLAIECDGVYWHDKERDQKRDAKLKEKYHIRIQRFTDKQIHGNIRDLIIAALAS